MGLITQTGQAYYTGSSFGDYQFTSLEHIINQFIIAYVGEDKIISKIRRTDVAFHAQRALQELSFDTFKSTKSQEITLPSSLTMKLPQDYVNYVKISWSDSKGVKHVIQPTSKTSNPTDVGQDANNDYTFDSNELVTDNSSTTWESYQGLTPVLFDDDDYDDDIYGALVGQRYGIDPEHSQINGTFYMDPNTGLIHFSSNLAGKTIVLDYISDSLGTDAEMKVHKFAEEAMYKHIAYAILSTRANVQEYIVQRFKRERFAETRKAKLRLSNIKLEEITQILRGKSKHIKH
jgi:virulence-associated protein VagC